MLAIYKKELRSYFTSIIGYVFLALFLLVIGIFFTYINLFMQSASFEVVFNNIAWVAMLMIPLLTMRIMAEESKQKTDQLLYTSPIKAGSIVIGKFLSVSTMYGIVMLISCCYPVIMTLYGEVQLEMAYTAILGFFLMGAAYIALGIFFSSITESQVVAAVISYIVFLVTFFIRDLTTFLPKDSKSSWLMLCVIVLLISLVLYIMMHNLTITIGFGAIGISALTIMYIVKPTIYDGAMSKVFGWLSMSQRYDNFLMGIFDVSNIVYYISFVFLFLFLTTQTVKKKRWS